jgi:hypothetical protein
MNIFEKLTFTPDKQFDLEIKQNIDVERTKEKNLSKIHNVGAIKIKEEKDQKPFAIEAIKRCINTYNNFEMNMPFFSRNPKTLEVELYKIEKLWRQFVFKSVFLGVTQPTKLFIIRYLNKYYNFDIPISKTEAGYSVPSLHLAVSCAARKAIMDALLNNKIDKISVEFILNKLNQKIEKELESETKSETPVDVFKTEETIPKAELAPEIITKHSKKTLKRDVMP